MATITYKCLNCDADLTYQPGTGNFGCAYCGSSFTMEELESSIHQDSLVDEQAETIGNMDSDTAVVYKCPSCGAEIVMLEKMSPGNSCPFWITTPMCLRRERGSRLARF